MLSLKVNDPKKDTPENGAGENCELQSFHNQNPNALEPNGILVSAELEIDKQVHALIHAPSNLEVPEEAVSVLSKFQFIRI